MDRIAALLAVTLVIACSGAAGAPPASARVSPDTVPHTVVVTRADDRGTVRATVGDRIQISLGTDYEWRLDPPAGPVLAAGLRTELLVRGTQAVWTAAAPGTAAITATGTVVCPSGQACILIALSFATTVVVAAP